MASTLTTRPRPPGARANPPRPRHSVKRLFEPAGQTLEASILGVWEDLQARGRAGCPVCGGTLRAGAGCESCGSELS